MKIAVQSEPFDFGAEAAGFASGHEDQGAVVTFTGIVRNTAEGTLKQMRIEHYPGMTEKALAEIAGHPPGPHRVQHRHADGLHDQTRAHGRGPCELIEEGHAMPVRGQKRRR